MLVFFLPLFVPPADTAPVLYLCLYCLILKLLFAVLTLQRSSEALLLQAVQSAPTKCSHRR